MREGGAGEETGNGLPRRVQGRLVSALATLLLPVLLAGLLVGAGELRNAGAPSATQAASGVAAGGSTAYPHRPGAAPPPWPAPPQAYFDTRPGTTWPTLVPRLHDRAAILVDLTTNRVLYEDNALEPLPTASLAKLVTVLVALRHASLQTVLTVPEAATQLDSDETRMGLTAGERLTVEELIQGIFLQSANDAALVLAQTIVPELQFIQEMNALVRSWGLPGASFSNPTGLDAPGEVASAYDLAVVAAHLVREQPELLLISDQKQIRIPRTPSHKAYDLSSVIAPVLHGFPGANGLKTGFTDNAGYCLALTDKRGARSLLAVVLDSPKDVDDAEGLITYGFFVDPV